jgi:hypothetical protein
VGLGALDALLRDTLTEPAPSTQTTIATPTEVPVEGPNPARACVVALAYVSGNNGERVSTPDLIWPEENAARRLTAPQADSTQRGIR